MKSTMVRLEPKEHRAAKKFAKETGRNIQYVVNQALREYLAKQQQSQEQAA